MSGFNKIIHNGKEIVYIDYRGCKGDDALLDVLKAAQKGIVRENKEYLQLTDFRETFVSQTYMKRAKEAVKDTPKLAIKRAVVGINSPAKKMLLMAYNLILGKDKAVKPFADIEDAKDWLTSE